MIGLVVGGICLTFIMIFTLHKRRQITNKEHTVVSTKPLPGTYFNNEALNNPVYDENITETDDGYIDSNTYEEPVMNTESLKQINLYDLTIDSTYNDIETSDNMYDIASQEPENLYVLGSNNNEFYDNINENN